MRIVLDTNVLVRVVTSPNGPAAELFRLITRHHRLVMSTEIGTELADVLLRDQLRQYHQLDTEQVHEFVQSLMAGSSVVTLPPRIPRVVPHDPDDDSIIATAVFGAADVLCTWNKHLFHQDVTDYCRPHAIEIMDDPQLIAILQNELPRL